MSGELRGALNDHFPQWKEIFVFECMRIIHVTPIKNHEFYYNESYLSEMMRDVSTYLKHIVEVLRSVSMDRKAINEFLKRLLSKSRYIAVDLTYMFSSSENVIFSVLGHDPDEKVLHFCKQACEIFLCFQKNEGIPFQVSLFQGRVVKRFFEKIRRKEKCIVSFHRIEKEMGTIVVITDLNVSGEILYNMLKSRVDIEQAYDTSKNTLDADRSYIRDYSAMQGWMFVNFIAMLLHYTLRKKDLLRKYTPKDVLDYLRRVNKFKISKER
ncbi:MAG: hypothetical protein QW046_00345 [Candidatus Micrarchaeaceae archaeon]